MSRCHILVKMFFCFRQSNVLNSKLCVGNMTRHNSANSENISENELSRESSIVDEPEIRKKYSSLSRKNGWSWPLHPRQILSWLVLLFLMSYYFCTLCSALWSNYIYPGYVVPAALALCHLITNIWCVSSNPADPNVLRRDSKKPLPTFDHTKHAHVIENLYCNICETSVTDDAKHCSYCNKCIEGFDHHCFWLNNCIGRRNYRVFIVCLASALLCSLVVISVSIVEIVVYFLNTQLLYSDWPHDRSIDRSNSTEYLLVYYNETSGDVWISVLFVFLILNVITVGLLGHLLIFHFYLISQNLTTYAYIVRMRDRDAAKDNRSVSRRSRGRVAPMDGDQQMNIDKVTPTEEDKRNFGLELRNGAGEKPTWSGPTQERRRSTPTSEDRARIEARDKRATGDENMTKSEEQSTKPKKKKWKKLKGDPDVDKVVKDLEKEFGLRDPNETNGNDESDAFRRRSAGTDSGIVISPNYLLSSNNAIATVTEPTNVEAPSSKTSDHQGGDFEERATPLVPIPIDALQTLNRSEMEYLHFS